MNSHWLAEELEKDQKKKKHPARNIIAVLSAVLLLGGIIALTLVNESTHKAALLEIEQQQAEQLQKDAEAKAQVAQEEAAKQAAANAEKAKKQEYYTKCLKLVDDTYYTQISMITSSTADLSTMATLNQTANSNRDYSFKKCDQFK